MRPRWPFLDSLGGGGGDRDLDLDSVLMRLEGDLDLLCDDDLAGPGDTLFTDNGVRDRLRDISRDAAREDIVARVWIEQTCKWMNELLVMR